MSFPGQSLSGMVVGGIGATPAPECLYHVQFASPAQAAWHSVRLVEFSTARTWPRGSFLSWVLRWPTDGPAPSGLSVSMDAPRGRDNKNEMLAGTERGFFKTRENATAGTEDAALDPVLKGE